MATKSYLPYHEPSLSELLISSTFLLALNVVNSILDRTLACGLIGQVLIGTAWGVPGARWLTIDMQRVVSSLGYLGLILIVYAGGVETNVVALRKNLVLSVAVAITGIAMPIALSFALLASDGQFLGKGGPMPPLQAFAAGAALCSTSLGTTFSVLQTSGLTRTRLGAVLASAALLDDVVGLVMVRIITSLGKTGDVNIEPATILRPVLVSVAFAVAVPPVCRYLLKPGHKVLDRIIQQWDSAKKESDEGNGSKRRSLAIWIRSEEAGFVFQTALLILLIVAADYAGASILLAAYLAGVVVSWWDGQRDDSKAPGPSPPLEAHRADVAAPAEQQSQDPSLQQPRSTDDGPSSQRSNQETSAAQHLASRVFETYYAQAVNRLLKPFFFASIGFSIPVSQLFVGDILWRGIVYAVLMTLGKLACGLWLMRFPISIFGPLRSIASLTALKYDRIISKIRFRSPTHTKTAKTRAAPEPQASSAEPIALTASPRPVEPSPSPPPTPAPSSRLATPPKPISLYPAAVMGCAMVARGEIGFLISSTAESQGVFRRADEDASKASELFLIVTWAIFLCTIFGPLCTGLLVRRIKKLEALRSGSRNVLGVWGMG
ncbi:Sodium/hydrogen exchanger [Xylaria nigripes]|nr:Sodium/hydrogen exchanger [Xylaria nigripes]